LLLSGIAKTEPLCVKRGITIERSGLIRKAVAGIFAERWTWESDAEFWYLDRTGERSYDLYFRDDARMVFGVIKFPRSRDNPFGFAKLKEKIMNDAEFRKEYLDAGTQSIWKRSWK